MPKGQKQSITRALESVTYLANRTPSMAAEGGAESAFANLSDYRDGAIYVGHYSGSSEWERHSQGDEIVMVIEGTTTVILMADGTQERIDMQADDLVVVPQGTWHRFENSTDLKVLTVTPQPTDHQLDTPET